MLAMAAMTSMASVVFASVPALIPMPREMKLTGGSVALAVTNSSQVEVVASIQPEGYELSITKDGVTIRHSDDAGLFYAKVTFAQLRSPETATLPSVRYGARSKIGLNRPTASTSGSTKRSL